MCYSPPPMNFVAVSNEHFQDNIVTVEIEKDCIVEARVDVPKSEKFSFRITDLNEKLIQSGEITADDGKFDSHSEKIKIEIKKDIPKGKYKLYFYAVELKEIKEDALMHCSYYDLVIK